MSVVASGKRSWAIVASDRARFRRGGRPFWIKFPARAACALFIILCGIMLAIAGDYGVAWDDAVQTEYGCRALDYFLTWGRDRSCNEWLDLRFYGPVVELPIAALSRIYPERLIEIRHCVCAGIALLSIPSLLRFGRLLAGIHLVRGSRRLVTGRWLGVLAVAFVWTMPRFFGHAFLNSKDIPFAVGLAASLAALAETFARGRFRWMEIVRCGLLIGLTTAVRPGGWMLIGPYYVALCTFVDMRSGLGRRCHGDGGARGSSQQRSRPRRTIVRQGVMLLVAWTVMTLPWPWAHQSPLTHPLQAIRMASKFPLVVPVLFEGQVVTSDQLPRDYLIKYILFTTPPAILLLGAVGAVVAGAALVRRPQRRRSIVLFTLLIWPTLPLALFVCLRPNAYDGLRHFLFILPALALFAALGTAWLWAQCDRVLGKQTALILATASLAVAFTSQLGTLVRLHPYQMTYFNSFAGGMSGVEQRFETDYWLTSYQEAIGWIRHSSTQPCSSNQRTTSQAPEHHKPRVLVAANEHSRWCADYFAGSELQIETTLTAGQQGDVPSGFDYYVATTRAGMADNFPDADTVCVIGRAGAIFAVIKCPADRSAPTPPHETLVRKDSVFDSSIGRDSDRP